MVYILNKRARPWGGGECNETTGLTATPFPLPPDLQEGDLLFHRALSILERVDAIL